MTYKRALVLAGLLSTSLFAFATIFGTVSGLIHDPQHRPVQGAQVTLHAANSAWTKSVSSNESGEFRFDSVPLGEYSLTVELAGFAREEQKLVLSSGRDIRTHFSLTVAQAKETVEVKDESVAVNPESSTTATLVSRQQIAQTPGADQTNSLSMITNYVPSAYMVHDQLHIRGGHQVSWLIDGVPVPNTNIASNVGPQFDPKDIDYLEVQRGGYSAEYGDRTYGVFNVVTRSGFERDRQAELVTSYGSFNRTEDQFSIGDHTDRFAYYASVSANRSDFGLMPPEPDARHDATNGVSGFTSLIFNATPDDQLRLAASARSDFFQIPNTTEQQQALIRDVQRERDAFLNFTWVHTFQPGVLLNVAPYIHWNRAAYDGNGPIPSLLPDQPPIPTDHNDSRYEGAQLSLGVTRGRHNARFGASGFAQQDDSFFRVVATDGSGDLASERDRPTGGQFSLFAEDQFRAASWLTLNAGLRYTHFSGASVVEDHADPRIGAALHVPKLGWVFRAFYGRYYQAPPLTTVSGPLLEFAVDQGFEFLPLHGETDEQREFGLTIPIRGWTFDFSNFQTHALNFFDHDVLGNSNIFFPLTIERARIHGWESTVRSPRIAKRFDLYLTYSNQMVEGAGIVTGGLLAETEELCEGGGFCYLDHDQRNTLSMGFHASLPFHISASGNVSYGSGFLDGEGPDHLPDHTEFSLSLAKSFGERFSVGFTAQNLNNSRYLLDNSNTFGGTHWNYPRQFTGQIRYRFHF